jgi:phosphatidylglycerol lysyltransferase
MKTRWLLWIFIVAFVWIVISRFAEIKKLAEILVRGQWQWVLVAVGLQVVYHIVFTGVYASAFDTVGVRSRVLNLLPVQFASIFVNVAAPAAGVSGAALFVDDAARRGQSVPRAIIGTLLVWIADFGSFALVLVTGMVFLLVYHDLQPYEVAGAVALLILIVTLASAMLLGLWKPILLQRLLDWVQRTVNRLAARFRRPGLLDDEWAHHNTTQLAEAAQAIATQPRRVGRTFGIALSAHLVDLVTLFVLFLAFHQAVSPGVLVGGYSMGILFWIVAITPQGIGIVEGVMALVFTSLGVPVERATVIALAFRGLTFWLPLLIGFVLIQRVRTFGARERLHLETFSVHAVAVLTGLMGVINVLSAVTPSLRARLAVLDQYMPFEVRISSHLTAALAGFALLLLADGLWRRKRLAWLLTLIVLVISGVSHMLKGLDYEETALALGLAIWLILQRHHFHAESDRPSVWQGIRVLAAALTFTLAYGGIGFYMLDRHFSVNFGLLTALRQTVVMFSQFYNPGLEPMTRFGRYFADSIYIVGMVTLGYALLMLVRPVLIRQPATINEREHVQGIVEAHGRTSLARFVLLEDKSYYFHPGDSVVAYVAKGRAAVALGDPIGPRQDTAAVIKGFTEFCSHNDWYAAFYQTLPETLGLYRAQGFNALDIGSEGIVYLDRFSLEGRDSKSLRSAVNRLTRINHRAEFRSPPLTDDTMEQLQAVSDEWLAHVHGSEKHFSLGWFEDNYIRNSPVMMVMTPEGECTAFANIVTEYQANEITIDLMRHRRQVENGTMDFLFTSLFQWAKEQGYATFNLGMSTITGMGSHDDDPAVERTIRFIAEHMNQFYNFKGISEFKEKYHPEWSPRYLIFPGVASLPAVGMALVRADSSDNFIRDYARGLFKKGI